MTDARDRQPDLLGLRDQQIVSPTTLLAILKTERKTLNSRYMEALSRSGDLKHRCLAELDALDADRRQLSELVGLLEQCRVLNEANGRLVALQRQHVQRALPVLRGADPETQLYGPDGNPAGLAGVLPLSSVWIRITPAVDRTGR